MKQDEQMDRLLRQAAVPDTDPPVGACLEADTLAAWVEGSLMSREREAAEAHAADCPRCLAALAALTTTLPTQAAVPWWSRWFSWRLLVPLTAGAAAVAIWVAVQSPDRSAFSPGTASREAVSRPAEEGQLARGGEADSAKAAPPVLQDEMRPAVPPSADPDLADRLQGKREGREAAAAKADSGNLVGSTEAARRDSTAAAAAEAASPARPAAPAAEAPPADTVAPPGAAPPAAARTRGLAESVVAPIEIRSPDPAVRWRIAGSAVEHSLDGGRTWQAQDVPTGEALTAGSSPSRTICWLVGRAGTVLLFTQADGWRPLPFPEPADLTSVAADSGTTAAVTTANGRTYRTVDAGRRWTLQETPAHPF